MVKMMGKRDVYVERLKAQLDEWNAELDKLEAKTQEFEASARLGLQEDLKELRKKRDAAKARLAEIQEASEEAWEDLVHGFERSWDIFKESVEQAVSRFK